jgi:predicted transcriptional regulator
MDISLTDREADVMQVLWEQGPSVVSEVRDRLADLLAYTTVLTILEEGRVHRYYAAVQQQAAQRSALRHLTGKFFKGSSELLFAQLVSDRKLSKEQVRRMRELLRAKSDSDKE